MFTGIIETKGVIQNIEKEGNNYHFTIASPISKELKIDQSVSHNGVCLTVIDLAEGTHKVTAIEETLNRSNLKELNIGDGVNIERAMVANGRLDGHIVQGHVDATAKCIGIQAADGSWNISFQYIPSPTHMLVDKGSVCINGISLTVVDPIDNQFSVAIIPYTFEETSFHDLKVGDTVNIEFDIIGKYIAKHIHAYLKKL